MEPVTTTLPHGFADLQAEARAGGYPMLERLAADWATGVVRFDRPGELLVAAFWEQALAGIGGLTVDPFEVGALRMRRFYVRASLRRHGIGRALALRLLERATQTGQPVIANAATVDGPAFWERLGFVADARNGHTHILRQTGR